MGIDTRVGEFKIYDGADWDILYPKTTIANVSGLSTALADIQGDIDDLEDTNIGKVGNVSLVTLSTPAAWAALPVGTMVMIHSTSTGRPSWMTSYVYVIKGPSRDSSLGYSVMAINYLTGEMSAGKASDNTVYPTWFRSYNVNNKPSASDIGAAAVSHGTHVLSKDTPLQANYLDSNIDLDDTTAAGFYYQTSNANTSGNNYPSSQAGSLLVQKSAGTCTQMYITYDDGDIYTRTKYTSWTSWKKFVKEDSIPVGTASVVGGAKFSYSGGVLTIDTT